MILVRIRKIKKSYKDKVILKDINLDIKDHCVMGLVGNNGAGKTTLAKIIIGEENYDSGSIEAMQKNVKINYLKQSSEFSSQNFQGLLVDEKKDLSLLFEKSSLLGLRHVNQWSNERLNHLSGGEKTKLSLSEVFNEPCHLLILDEPTNHLDYKGIDWLISEIKKFSGSVLIISHDRYFLDQVTEEIVELESGIMNLFKGNYTFYRKEKEKLYQSQMHQYEEQKKKERKIDQEINQLKKWSHVAHRDSTKKEGMKEYWRKKAKKKDVQIKSTIKRLEKMKQNGVRKPEDDQHVLFDFVSDEKFGKSLLTAENVSKYYNEHLVFKNCDFYIKRGEKVGLIGENGCGKTTLIHMILGMDKDYNGSLFVSNAAKIAYLSQDVLDLNEDMSVYDMIKKKHRNEQTRIRTFLATSGITERMIKQKIGSLSLGERTRIKLVFLILEENNVLILDEPTNHLDLHSREQLERTLSEYQGTILIASHDRYLLEKITDKCLIFENKNIQRREVGFKEYNKPKENKDEELLVIQNQLTYVLGELSKYQKTDDRYQQLDEEFKQLIERKNNLKGEKRT